MKETNLEEKPSLENAGVNNTLPPPETLEKEVGTLEEEVGTSTEYCHFKAPNANLYLNIDGNGWAYWSGQSHAIFSKYNYRADTYLILQYHNKYTGNYLSYSNNGYVGVYSWKNSVPWTTNPLRVKNKSWKTYEYEKSGTVWVVIGNYNYTQRNLNEKGGFGSNNLEE